MSSKVGYRSSPVGPLLLNHSKPIHLPNKPSELIEVAMEDLRAIERSNRFKVDMNVWCLPFGPICKVCLAGSVMVRRFKVDPTWAQCPSDFPKEERDKLFAIDCFRNGKLLLGLYYMDASGKSVKKAREAGLEDRTPTPHYDWDRRRWKAAMQKLIRDLKSAGL